MKIIVFENDSDFEFFAIRPSIYIKHANERSYCDWDFTDDYLKEVENNTLFFIKDPKSRIVRRKAVCYGVIAKTVKNVSLYNSLIADSENPEIEIENYTKNII